MHESININGGLKGSTVLSDIHADLLHTGCPIGLGWLDDFTSWPDVVEHKHGHRRETKHTEPGHSQHIGEEDKLSRKGQRIVTGPAKAHRPGGMILHFWFDTEPVGCIQLRAPQSGHSSDKAKWQGKGEPRLAAGAGWSHSRERGWKMFTIEGLLTNKDQRFPRDDLPCLRSQS